VAAVAISLWQMRTIGDALYTEVSLDIWFQADTPRVLVNLLDPTSDHYRSSVHPIFGILLTPWVSALGQLGQSPLLSAKAVIAVTAGASAGAVWFALRLAGIAQVSAALYTAVFLASASFLHWYSVVEVAAFNGLSICVVLLVLALGRSAGLAAWVLASGLSLGITITNWTAALAATVVRWPLRRSLAVSAIALGLVFVLALAQKAIYPTSELFFDVRLLARERQYVARATSPLESLRSLIVYTQITPAPTVERRPDRSVVSNQGQAPETAGILGVLAILAWIGSLACGLAAALRVPNVRPLAAGLLLMIGAQLALGAVYGDIAFLYAANLSPMLVMLAGLSALTPWRHVGAALAVVVILAGGISNHAHFVAASALSRDVVLAGGNPTSPRLPDAGPVLLPAPNSSGPQAAP
jgi:hypothetical protein